MSGQMPELGSKISLISKADIRYEGRLFTVDPQECTIALASVRSFGTEDRETQIIVPAQSQVYDYILFRGSDIKDIRVMTAQMPPNDPAIVQLVPPNVNQQVSYQGPGFGHPVMAPPVASALGQYSGYSGLGGTLGGLQRAPAPLIMQPSELGASGPPPHPDLQQPPLPHVPIGPLSIDKDQDLIGGASRSTTPSLTRKSPTNDQGTQVNNSPSRDDHKKPRPIQPPHRQQREPMMYQQGGQRNYQNDRRNYQNDRRDYQNERRDYQNDRRDYQNERRDYQNDRRDFQNQNKGYRSRDRNDQENREPRRDQNQNRGGMNMGGGGGGMWNMRNNNSTGRPRGNRPRGPGKQYNRQVPGGSGLQQPGQVKKNAPKFEVDYDFDKANTEFEKLRSQISNIKIGSADDVTGTDALTTSSSGGGGVGTGTTTSTVNKLNGEIDKNVEGVEGDNNEIGVVADEVEATEPCYDKSKSFFDTISCESVERSKGRSQRTDWRTERKLNSETFGVSSTRRGGYRTRGHYGSRNYTRPHVGGQRPQHQQQAQQTGDNNVKTACANDVKVVPSAASIVQPASECQS